MTRKGWLKRRVDEEWREEGAVARWHEKEELLAEGGEVTVWKQTGKTRAQTPPPSLRVPMVWECEQCPLGGRAGKAVSSFGGDSGFSASRHGGRKPFSVKFIFSGIVSFEGKGASKGYREEWERALVGR